MKTSNSYIRCEFIEIDCHHWMIQLSEQSVLNNHIDDSRKAGAEPDTLHWLQIDEDSVVVSTQKDGVKKRTSVATCAFKSRRFR